MSGAEERSLGQSSLQRRLRILRSFGPVIGPTSVRDLVAGAAGSGIALMICAAVLVQTAADLSSGAFLIAPMGATCVILFALPNSPLAQPWSAIVGNSVSALMALAVHQVVRDPVIAIGLSAFLALGAMLLSRSLHPPGGAVALTASLNQELLDVMGVQFVLGPVFLGTTALVCFAMLWHKMNRRIYPFRQPHAAGFHAITDKPAQQRLGLEPQDLERILTQYRQSANLGVEDLARLIGAAEQAAAGHAMGATTSAEIMSRDLKTVSPMARAAQVAELFRKHGFTSIPVVDTSGVFLGMIFQIDLIRRARRDALRANTTFGKAMSAIRRDRTTGIVYAADIMTKDIAKAKASTPIAELLPLLAESRVEAVPIIEGQQIIGIVTRTDLLSAQARAGASGERL